MTIVILYFHFSKHIYELKNILLGTFGSQKFNQKFLWLQNY